MLDETELKRKWLIEEKPHTCEEVGGTPQNFLLAFIDELWETRKIRILKKWKKIAGKIEEKKKQLLILHMCTKNYNHMRNNSWDTEWDNFFVILGHFLPFNSPLYIPTP